MTSVTLEGHVAIVTVEGFASSARTDSRFPPLRPLHAAANLAHRAKRCLGRDAERSYLFYLEDPQRIYLGVDNEPAPQCAVMDWLSAQLGLAPLLRTAVSDDRGKGGKRCRNARLLASGYRFLYPSYRNGYGAVLKAARAI